MKQPGDVSLEAFAPTATYSWEQLAQNEDVDEMLDGAVYVDLRCAEFGYEQEAWIDVVKKDKRLYRIAIYNDDDGNLSLVVARRVRRRRVLRSHE